MCARCRRFLSRIRGTQRIIVFVVLAYDLALYYQMVQAGMGWFAASVMTLGIVSGTLIAWLLTNAQTMLGRFMTAAGYTVTAIFLLGQGANLRFPLAIYFASHTLLWFWFTTLFWFASRPEELAVAYTPEAAEPRSSEE